LRFDRLKGAAEKSVAPFYLKDILYQQCPVREL